jgi:hypothetical protein
MADLDIRRWALKGAEQRLVEIAAEATAIYGSFPELRDRRGQTPADGNGALATRKRRRFRVSEEARQRIAEAQRKRWAKQRAGKQVIRTPRS